MKRIALFFLALIIYPCIHTTMSNNAPSSTLNFSGKVTDRQGYTIAANHIRLANRKDDIVKMQEVPFYALPHDTNTFKKIEKNNTGQINYELNLNPATMLRVEYIDFNEVESIEVPKPDELWTYKIDKKAYQIDYLEVALKHKGSTKARSLLLELGRSDSQRPMKLFFSQLSDQAQQMPQGKEEFCPGVKKEDLLESGMPLQALKKIVITGYCHEVPITPAKNN